jgi:hypothetical protein
LWNLFSINTLPPPDPNVIDTLCGKYRNYLSNSEEFARRKQEDIEIEERKWQGNLTFYWLR